MSKSDKQRVGLQRKVSSVFKGVTVPGEKHTGEPSPVPAKDDNVANSAEVTPKDGSLPTVTERKQDNSQSVSPESEAGQIPVSDRPAQVEKATDDVKPRPAAKPAPPVSKKPKVERDSLMKKLAQSYEPDDTSVCPPSTMAKPEVAQVPESKTDGNKSGDTAKQVANKKPSSQSSLMKKLAQSDEQANEDGSVTKADVPVTKKTQREPSLNRKPKNERRPEASAASTSQNKHPLADQLANAVDDEGFLQKIKDKLMPSEGGSAKDKVMVMLVPILAIVMIFVFRHVLQKPPSKASAAKKNDDKVVAVNKSDGEIEWKIPDPLPTMTRDPLQLPQDEDTENPNDAAVRTTRQQGSATTAAQIRNGIVNVRTIVYSEDKASALVGNSIVYAGSKINDVTVVKINRDSVEFESNGETWVQKVRN